MQRESDLGEVAAVRQCRGGVHLGHGVLVAQYREPVALKGFTYLSEESIEMFWHLDRVKGRVVHDRHRRRSLRRSADTE